MKYALGNTVLSALNFLWAVGCPSRFSWVNLIAGGFCAGCAFSACLDARREGDDV